MTNFYEYPQILCGGGRRAESEDNCGPSVSSQLRPRLWPGSHRSQEPEPRGGDQEPEPAEVTESSQEPVSDLRPLLRSPGRISVSLHLARHPRVSS